MRQHSVPWTISHFYEKYEILLFFLWVFKDIVVSAGKTEVIPTVPLSSENENRKRWFSTYLALEIRFQQRLEPRSEKRSEIQLSFNEEEQTTIDKNVFPCNRVPRSWSLHFQSVSRERNAESHSNIFHWPDWSQNSGDIRRILIFAAFLLLATKS